MKFKRSALAAFVALFAASSSNVQATNGIFLIGNGAKSRAMGGVGIGFTQDSIGNQLNPAGIANFGVSTMQVDVDAMLLEPRRSTTLPDPRPAPNAGNPITYTSGANLYMIPSMGMAYKFNRKMYVGFSFVGAGGGGTRYTKLSPLGFNFFNPVGRVGISDTLAVTYQQAQMAMTAAYVIDKKHTVAVSPIVGIQQFRAAGLGVFQPFSSNPDRLTGNGNDWAYGMGVRLGWQGNLTDWLTMGATYTSRIYFNEFEKYSGLFAEGGDLDAPENFGIGFAIKPSDRLTIAFDWQRVLYSDVAAIGNPIEQLGIAGGAGFLGTDIGAGFGWDDANIYKLGFRYRVNDQWDALFGLNYGEKPMPDDQLLFSAVAPAVTEKHISMGAVYRQSANIEWTFAYVHAFNSEKSGVANSSGQFDTFFPNSDFTGPGDMMLQMEQDSVELTFSYKL